MRQVLQQRLQVDEKTHGDLLRTFYVGRGHAPVWVEPGGVRARADTLLARLCDAGHEGLSSNAYDLSHIEQSLHVAFMEDATDTSRARAMAELELSLSRAFLTYADFLAHGRVPPEKVPGNWPAQEQPRALLNVLGEAVGRGSVDAALREQAARSESYAALREALARYRTIEDRGGWVAIPDGPALKRNDTGARVAALRQRLAATDDLSPGAADSTFDGAVEAAVRRFQQRHGLAPSGTADAEVLAALNVPVEVRIDQLTLNLERLRWMPDHLGDEYVLVNIPAFDLHAYRGGEDVLSMQVIVGQRMNQTPVFADTLTHVVFHPYWNIPQSIAEAEIIPRVREDRGYVDRQGIQVVRDFSPDAEVLDADAPNLDRVVSGEFRLRQAPGPENPLGRVKFMFPNEWDVYLHDTPTDYLFSQTERGFSHGCIRVERPIDLAAYVLEARGDWPRSRIESVLRAGETQHVDLARPIPVHIVYLTAWVDEQSQVQFRSDLYGHDAGLRQVLREDAPENADATCVSIRHALDEM